MGTNNFGKKYLARKILGRKNWASANPQTLGGGGTLGSGPQGGDT